MTNDLTLREVAQSILDENQVSGRQLSELARKRGLTLSYTTINRLAAGDYTSHPSDKTLTALAMMSRYSVEQVYAAAGAPVPLKPLAEDLPPDADTLTPEQRDTVLSVVRQFAKANRALAQLERQEQRHGTPQEGTPNTQAAGSAAHNEHNDVMPAPPTADEVGLPANRAPRERAFDDQNEG